MRVLKAGGGLGDVPDREGQGDRPAAGDELVEGPPLHILQDDVVGVALLGDVVNADDVRVVEGRRRAGLAHEPLDAHQVVRAPLGAQHLDGDAPAQGRVFGQVDGTHAALPQEILDEVRPEPEPPVPAGEQLLRLEAGEQPLPDQHVGRAGRVGGQVGGCGEPLLDGRGGADPARAHEVEELRGRIRGRYCGHLSIFLRK